MNDLERKENNAKKGEEKKLRLSFLRLLGKYDFHDSKQFKAFTKWFTFIILSIVEILILLEHLNNFIQRGGVEIFMSIIILSTLLTCSQVLRFFVVKSDRGRTVFFVIDAVIAASFVFVTTSVYTLFLCLVVLTGFYLSTEKIKTSMIMLVGGILSYGVCYVLQLLIGLGGTSEARWLPIFTEAFGSAFVFIIHYIIVQIALAFYRQYLKLHKAMKELNASKQELQKAYEAVAEVTALEERQRIAKEIHDTAGHSLTTVIMQTETAKRIIDKNPDEAKQKIVAANLQAKNTLEKLRDSVHLLSDRTDNQTLKTILEDIIHDSTDGTGITIRSSIEEMQVSSAKARFLSGALREGISNGLRHGNATAFWFELMKEENKIKFLLSDNGTGVAEKDLKIGFGLQTMQERVKALGGEVKMHSEQGEGFEISITLPCDIARE